MKNVVLIFLLVSLHLDTETVDSHDDVICAERLIKGMIIMIIRRYVVIYIFILAHTYNKERITFTLNIFESYESTY